MGFIRKTKKCYIYILILSIVFTAFLNCGNTAYLDAARRKKLEYRNNPIFLHVKDSNKFLFKLSYTSNGSVAISANSLINRGFKYNSKIENWVYTEDDLKIIIRFDKEKIAWIDGNISYSFKKYPASIASVIVYKDNSSVIIGELILDSKGNKYSISLGTSGKAKHPIDLKSIEKSIDLIFVNRNNPLEDNFKPDLINMNSIKGFKPQLQTPSMQFGPIASIYLNKMMNAAAEDGVQNFLMNSSYRSIAEQRYLFDYMYNVRKNSGQFKTDEEAYMATWAHCAKPNTSEHHTGNSIDILAVGYNGNNFYKSKQSKWLNENSWKYGFILRYPEDKQKETYTIYEPWHFRYLGIPHAEYITKLGLCYEEFADYIRENNGLIGQADGQLLYLVYGVKEKQFKLYTALDEIELRLSSFDKNADIMSVIHKL